MSADHAHASHGTHRSKLTIVVGITAAILVAEVIALVRRLIRTEGVTTVFSESLVSADVADQLARDTGVRSAVLDPIEGLTDQSADEDYLSLMRSNLAALEEANGCA